MLTTLVARTSLLIPLVGAACFSGAAADGAHGGAGGGSDAAGGMGGSGPSTSVLGGRVAVGRVRGATVVATDAQTGEELGRGDVNDDGDFELAVPGEGLDVLLATEGGVYVDPSSEDERALPVLRTIVVVGADASRGCAPAITPWTELAVRGATSPSAEATRRAAAAVAQLAGGAEILCELPFDRTQPGGAEAGRGALDHGASLAAFAALSVELGGDDAALDALEADFAAAPLDLGAAYLDALQGFVGSGADRSGDPGGNSMIEASVGRVVGPAPWPVSFIDVARCGAQICNIIECRTIACDEPPAAGVRADVNLYPPLCDRDLDGDCADGEIFACTGSHCGMHVDLEAHPDASYSTELCGWYLASTDPFGPSPSACEGAVPRWTEQLEVPEANDGGPRVEILLPSDHGLEGSILISIDDRDLVGVPHARQLVAPRLLDREERDAQGNVVIAGETCPFAERCSSLYYHEVDSGLEPGPGPTTFTFLTTYGFEWSLTVNVPASPGAETLCNAFTGECVGVEETGDGTLCERVCANLAAQCPGSEIQCGDCADREETHVEELECCSTLEIPPDACEDEIDIRDCDDLGCPSN